MNIIITSFEGVPDKLALERTFRNIPLGTCFCIRDDEATQPDLQAKELVWMREVPLREGRFDDIGVDWNALAPLDEDLIESMRGCETVFLFMVGKYANKNPHYYLSGQMPYSERRRQYFHQLRYWNDFLDRHKIDAVLAYHMPHKAYDWVLYHLCKHKGIAYLYLERLQAIDAIYLVRDWEESVTEIRDAVKRLQEEYANPEKPIPLSQQFEAYFTYFRRENIASWYKPKLDGLVQGSFMQKWWKKAFKVLRKNPQRFFASVTSRDFWTRKLEQHQAIQFYDRHAKVPDLTKPYIYFPLHLQPEASAVPLSGVFGEHQERVVQLISTYLPKNMCVYVKEHPAQGERARSVGFYTSFLSHPSVTFVPRTMDTFTLLDHAIGVATGTGTIGFEAYMRQKPVLMFGHYYYQYAPGVYRIHSAEDCRKAVEDIVAGVIPNSERDIRIFLRAIEETGTPFPGAPDKSNTKYTYDEKVSLWAALMEKHLRAIASTR